MQLWYSLLAQAVVLATLLSISSYLAEKKVLRGQDGDAKSVPRCARLTPQPDPASPCSSPTPHLYQGFAVGGYRSASGASSCWRCSGRSASPSGHSGCRFACTHRSSQRLRPGLGCRNAR